jgi:ABC-type multidrug transport system ATPase subunit
MKLICDQLTKYYGKNKALDGFSYEFTPGIYGLLGPNGAGKSTLMNLITCNLKATSGDIRYGNALIQAMGKEYRSKLGFMPQQQNIYPRYTVERFLMYMAGLKGLGSSEARTETDRLLEMVNLTADRKKRLGELSGGMKQRALLAQALLGKPEIIILDEPTAGVDPKERIQMRNIISQVGFSCIIMIATHVVPDVQFIAKEILLLGKGQIIDSGTPTALQGKMEGKVFEITTDEEHFQEVCRKYRTVQMTRNGEEITLRVVSDSRPAAEESKVVRPDLEDLYLYHFE